MKAKKSWLFPSVAFFFATSLLAAPTVYVDRTRPDDSGDGTTPETAKRTLQAGVDAADAGGTVRVLPGVYDEGIHVDTLEKGGHRNRVIIGRDLTLESTGGQAVTHIVGAFDAAHLADRYGLGPDAIRGILVTNAAATVTIRGFTIRGCAAGFGTSAANTPLQRGGGVCVATSETEASGTYRTTVSDCTIRDCVAVRGAGACGAVAVRTLFDCNRALNPLSSGIAGGGDAMTDGQLYWCVARNNLGPSSAVRDGLLVNCTIAGCAGVPLAAGKTATAAGSAATCAINTYICHAVSRIQTEVDLVGVHAPSSVAPAADGWTRTDCCFTTDDFQIMGPAVEDYRRVSGGALDTLCPASTLSRMPEAFRAKDFLGAAVDSSALRAGAVQTAAAPAGGTVSLRCAEADGALDVDGHAVRSLGLHAIPDVYPTQYVCTVVNRSSAKQLLYWWRSEYDPECLPPDLQDRLAILPPSAVGIVSTNLATFTANVLYVNPDPTKGDDESNDGLSTNAPFCTLQRAAEAAKAKWGGGGLSIIRCAAGTYDRGEAVFPATVTNRLVLHTKTRVIGAGAGKSVIVGRADPAGAERHSGCGAAAIRCACADFYTAFCALQGFTLKDGHATIGGADQSVASVDDNWTTRGGGFYVDGGSDCHTYVTDCVITNCSAKHGAAAYDTNLQRCRVIDCPVMANAGGGSAFFFSSLFGCEIKGYGGGDCIGNFTKAYNTSIYWESGVYNHASGGRIYNCLASPQAEFKGDGAMDVGSYAGADVGYVDGAGGDLRISTVAAAVGGGAMEGIADYCRYSTLTMDGRILFVNGKPTAGARQKPLRTYAVSSPLAGSVLTPSGNVYAAEGDSFSVSVTHATRHPLGFTVAGAFSEGVPVQVTCGAYAPTEGAAIPIEAVFSTNWYVNADSEIGSDDNTGFTPESPKLTLKGAMAADVRSGDVVNLAAGDYHSLTMIQSSTEKVGTKDYPHVAARVVVPAGVILRGAGAETTFIRGEAAKTDADEYGCGPDAVRCAYVWEDAGIENCTLADGYTDKDSSLTTCNEKGGGVLFSDDKVTATAYLRDCIVTNCVAARGGAEYGGNLYNCRVLGCRGKNNVVTYFSKLYGCYFDDNWGNCSGYGHAIAFCTFAAGNHVKPVGSPRPYCSIDNCLFLGTTAFAGTSGGVAARGNYYNKDSANDWKDVTNAVNTNVSCAQDELAVDAEGRPVIGANLGIDRALDDPPAALGGRDATGSQRVYNACADVGALEADWRGTYARKLGRRVTVTRADPTVRLVDGGIQIADGTLVVTGAFPSPGVRFTTTVTDGELAIEKDGESLGTQTAGSVERKVCGDGVSTLSFAHAAGVGGEGAALLSRFKSGGGFVLILR